MGSLEDREASQRDLNKLEWWVVTKQMKFKNSKPRILCLRQGNLSYMEKLRMGGWRQQKRSGAFG